MPQEIYLLDCGDVVPADKTTRKEHSFSVPTPHRAFFLTSETSTERDDWVAAISKAAATSRAAQQLRLRGGGVAPTELALTVAAQREFFASGATKSVGWRCEQIQKLCTAIAQASDRFSETQAADGVVPSHMAGAVGMLMGAMGYYLSQVAKWAAPKPLDDTLPAERRGGIECDWIRVMEPKGLVLNIAPWNGVPSAAPPPEGACCGCWPLHWPRE